MPIDWARVRELRNEIGAQDFAEVAELFLDEVASAVSALGSDPAEGSIASGLHFIKGSALNLGFAGLADACRRGESLASQGNANSVDIGGVQALFQAEFDEFNEGLESLSD